MFKLEVRKLIPHAPRQSAPRHHAVVRRGTIWALIAVLALGLTPVPAALAATSCNATVSPTIVSPGEQTALQFDIQNTGSDTIGWIRIQRPTLSYSVNGITQSGWTDTTNDEGTTLTDSSLPASATASIQLAIFTAPQEEGAQAWLVQVSANPNGSGAVTCSGSTETTIGTPPQPPTPNGISNIHLTHISPTSATVAWTSASEATTYLYYGTTSSYGSTATVQGVRIEHSVTITNLSPNTIYHYMVAGSTGQGDNYFSSDNTFVTPERPPAPVTPAPIIIQAPNGPSTPAVIPKVPGDTTAPSVTLTTVFNKPFAAAPVVRGNATDNGALAGVQYSIDGGLNWLPVTSVTGLGGKAASFSFTPITLEDGNYNLLVAAVDSNGNQARTAPATLVIDRLPPQLGPLVLSYGPEVLTPNNQGVTELLAGANYKISASAVGGPILMSLEAEAVEQLATTNSNFSLAQSPESGLWNGALTLTTPGIYRLVAHGLDGAGNRTERYLATVTVTPAGRIQDQATQKALGGAKITAYYFEPSLQTWQIWNGKPYGQTNPQVARPDGSYSLLLPKGQYYLTVAGPHYYTFTTDRFDVTGPLALAADFQLGTRPQFNIGSLKLALPDVPLRSQPLPKPRLKPIARPETTPLIGQRMPNFNLSTLAGATKRNLDFEGKPTVFTLLSTWSPSSQDQLGPLAEAQTNKDVTVVPVFSQERSALVNVYLTTAGYNLTGLVDPDGLLVPVLQTGSLPQHIFVDRNGRIKKVTLGVLSKDELLDQLGGL